MPDFIQQSFAAGLNQQVDATRLKPGEYPLLVNGRSRYDVIETVNLPVADPSVPTGNMQGVFSAGQYGIVFVDGKAYYKDYGNPNSIYTRIDPFQMSDTASQYWAALVPASTLNFQRSLGGAGQNYANSPVNLGQPVSASLQAMVVQDGLSQPWIIDSTAQARQTLRYEEWQIDDREYVPVMRQMMFSNGILYGIWAKDKSTILRSVSGRPLDYMVNINALGDKPTPTERDGGAQTTAWSVGFGEVTCLSDMNSPDGGFFVGLAGRSTKVVPDFSNPIFGEPQFDNTGLFPTGPLNQNCFTDVIGDSVFIDSVGIRSFNAVLQYRYEGKNSPFSAKVQRLFRKILQVQPCVGKFDNYALFAVKTVYGNGVLSYDEVGQTFSGLDIYPGVGPIKQFAEIKTANVRRLIFIDDKNLYEAYAGPVAKLQFYAGEWCSQDPKVAQTATVVKIVLTDVVGSGNVRLTPIIDGRMENPVTEAVVGSGLIQPVPQPVPFDSSDENVNMMTFNIGRVQSGWKVGLFIELDFQASISHISLSTKAETQEVAPGQAAISFKRMKR